jgi:prepilin-type N-terminal cleavage/methylation domain-containing protein
MSPGMNHLGFSLVEVMVASMITGIALMGMMGVMDIASREVHGGSVSLRALALAQGRLEAKRSVRWQALLEDDVDHDGIRETLMNDDGLNGDQIAGDHIYTAVQEQDGVTLMWTLEADSSGPLNSAALVVLRVTASYLGYNGIQELHMATIRANPTFAGQ